MKAVLWTDTFQLCVISSGFLAIMIKGLTYKNKNRKFYVFMKLTNFCFFEAKHKARLCMMVLMKSLTRTVRAVEIFGMNFRLTLGSGTAFGAS